MSLNSLLLKAGMKNRDNFSSVQFKSVTLRFYTSKGSCKVFLFSIARSPFEENVEYADQLKEKIGTRGCPIILME